MYRYPALVKLTVAAVGLAGASLFAWALQQGVDPTYAVGAFLATAALDASPARIRDDVNSSLTTVGIFTAMLLGGLPLAIVAGAGTLLSNLARKTSRHHGKFFFNAGQFVISAAAGAAVYEAVNGQVVLVLPQESLRGVAAIVASAVVVTLVNHSLVATIVRFASGDPIRATLSGVMGTVTLLQFFYFGLSVVASILIEQVHVIALLLLVVPALVARRGLHGFQAQQDAYDNLVSAFVKVIEVKDPYTRGHADRVASLSVSVAGHLGHGYHERRMVRYAAVLHDVGKVRVPLGIINKPCALDEEEAAVIREHPVTGAEILRDIEFLQPAIDIVRFHHERIDGRGYPYGVPGNELSQHVRIVTAVDAFDAMTSTRSYRRALTVQEALAELERHVGTQFDGVVVKALREVVEELDWCPTTAFESGIEGVVIPDRPGETTPAILGGRLSSDDAEPSRPNPLADERDGLNLRRRPGFAGGATA